MFTGRALVQAQQLACVQHFGDVKEPGWLCRGEAWQKRDTHRSRINPLALQFCRKPPWFQFRLHCHSNPCCPGRHLQRRHGRAQAIKAFCDCEQNPRGGCTPQRSGCGTREPHGAATLAPCDGEEARSCPAPCAHPSIRAIRPSISLTGGPPALCPPIEFNGSGDFGEGVGEPGVCPQVLGAQQGGTPGLPRRAARPSSTSIGYMAWFFLRTQNSLKSNQSALAHMNT